mmetsp:Transcript_3137/g.7547  ORF Transcript_3137/g.7547 Transcript_3137/m.7547 type:complete len:130 (+) Transcript_3137:35-424(+)
MSWGVCATFWYGYSDLLGSFFYFRANVSGSIGFRLFFFSGWEYRTVETTTKDAPTTKDVEAWKSKNIAEIMQLTTIENEVAKTLSTLSAYFTTTATISPPTACTVTTVHTRGVYPPRNPCRDTAAESFA